MFSKIEGALTPILSKLVSSEMLPGSDSDEFISLLSFLATLLMRHPRQFETIENFTREVMTKAIAIHAQHIPDEGRKFGNDTVITGTELREALGALESGRIRIHVPRDYSLGAALGTVASLTEALMQRGWTLAVADGSSFITSTHPVLLCWDQLDLHDRHPPGFGMENTTVYLPISPKQMMIGKFKHLKERWVIDAGYIAAETPMITKLNL